MATEEMNEKFPSESLPKALLESDPYPSQTSASPSLATQGCFLHHPYPFPPQGICTGFCSAWDALPLCPLLSGLFSLFESLGKCHLLRDDLSVHLISTLFLFITIFFFFLQHLPIDTCFSSSVSPIGMSSPPERGTLLILPTSDLPMLSIVHSMEWCFTEQQW